MSITWTPVRMRLSALKPWERNPRQMSKKAAERLLRSWREFGQVQTIAIGPDGEVYDGHQRLSALRSVHGGDYEVLALQASRSLTEDERERLVLLLHAGALGEWNWDALANWDAETLLDSGFDETMRDILQRDMKALDSLLESLDVEDGVGAPEDPGAQVDKAEELREKWGTELGQLWRIPSKSVPVGEHRIICGDCTDPQVVEHVMQGEKADAMWTDPPYGVEYVGRTKDALKIQNDSAGGLGSLLRGAFGVANGVLSDGAAIYIAHPAGALQLVFGDAILQAGWHLHQTLVWVKDRMVLGHSDYHYAHEPVYYAWKGRGRKWYGGRDKISVFQVERPSRNAEHPTMKPPELVEAMLANSTKRGNVVIDPFLGSGTTIVAAERIGRLGRGVEIEPKYVAVALERLAQMGLQPELISE